MATTFEKILLAGTQAAYDALATKDANKLYFCTDTLAMYKGDALYTDAVREVTSRPTTPAVGKIYHVTSTGTLDVYVNGAWQVIRLANVTSITAAATDEQIPTAKAVYDYVTQAIEDVTGSGDVVQNMEVGEAAATLKMTRGGAASNIVVPGVVTTPSYDATTRTITLPVSDGETVTIALGKDIFIDTAADNKYNAETGNIELHLNDGTKIEIPASALIDVYTGGQTGTATVSVSDGNVITCDVRLSAAEGNALTVAADGLFLSLGEYAKTADVEADIEAVEGKVTAVADRMTAAEGKLDVLNGDATTAGSVAKQVADAKSALQTEIQAVDAVADEALANSNTNAGNITTLQADVQTLKDAFGWGTF